MASLLFLLAASAPATAAVTPEYSAEARAARLEGTANAWAEIDRDGKVLNAGLLQGLGMGLDDKAVEAVRNSRFDSTLLKSSTQESLYLTVDVPFQLPQGPHWRIAHIVHRFSTIDRNPDPGARGWPTLSAPVMAKFVRPDDAACPAGGAVSLEFAIGKDGVPGEIRVVEGEQPIAGAAVRAAAEWRFLPARRDGEPASPTAELLLLCGPPDTPLTSRIAAGVSAPQLLRKVEPMYTGQARAARLQGTVLIYAEIGPHGYATHMRVMRPLGLGLDVQALDAVRQWKFKPGVKGSIPVTVAATIEVNFRLL